MSERAFAPAGATSCCADCRDPARVPALGQRPRPGALPRGPLECVCPHAEAYPGSLRDLFDPPAALYVAGGSDRLARLGGGPAATVVGGRRATPYAIEVATALGRDLAAAGVAVVSGLALGVDGAAHRGATSAGGPAIAVLGSGADVPYPRANASLYRRVLEVGVVVSEMPPGARPAPWSFPARNRLMAALGGITVVVEAAERSGSLITAGHAGDLGREVGAVPGRVTSGAAAGSNRLLRDGASVVRGADDVLDALFGVGLDAEGRARVAGTLGGGPEGAAADAGVVGGLDPPVRRVLEAVEAGHGVEAVGSEAGLGPGEVRAALGRLELLGLVRRDGSASTSGRSAAPSAPRGEPSSLGHRSRCPATLGQSRAYSPSRAPTPAAARESRRT